jgi:putative membrane protein
VDLIAVLRVVEGVISLGEPIRGRERVGSLSVVERAAVLYAFPRMDEKGDPRVFFAAERTLLAWVRTGLTVIGLGFIVARFGLFLRMISREEANPEPYASSTVLGVLFVLLGAAGISVGVAQFVRFRRTLPDRDRPEHYWLGGSVWFAALLAATGVALAVYLLVQIRAV